MEGIVHNSTGREFHSTGAATEKTLVTANLASSRDGTCNRVSSTDLRGWTGSYERRRFFRYFDLRSYRVKSSVLRNELAASVIAGASS